ncbi:MAG: type II secretion system F family protein [Candidatus Binatia bacterium]|jgi:tight adherence protein B
MYIGNLPTEPLLYVIVFGSVAAIVWNLWSVSEVVFAEYRAVSVAQAEASLADVYSTFSPERVFQLSLLAGGVIFILFSMAINWVAGLLFGAAALMAPRMIFNILREKRRALVAEQLVDALGLLANSVRAGLTLPQAMEILVKEMKPPITQEFGRVLQEYRLGTDFDQAMLNMARRVESRDLDILVNAVMVTRRSGGNVGEIFQNIAATIRERIRIEGKVRALSATGNMQALVMSSMPFGIMVVLYFMQPEYIYQMFSTTLGLIALTVVIAMVVAAFFWIRWIMDIDI